MSTAKESPSNTFRRLAAEYMDEHENAGIAAMNLIEWCRQNDPQALEDFLHDMAHDTVRNYLSRMDRSVRARTRINGTRSVFAEAARGDDEDQDEPQQPTAERLAPFLKVRYVVDASQNRRQLMEMSRQHLLFVADDYAAQAKALTLEAAFMRALAKKVGAGVVSDHFTTDQLYGMRKSLAL